MNDKTKACFTSHVVMHSIFGFGLGILIVTLIPALQITWLGLILMIGAVAADTMRKQS